MGSLNPCPAPKSLRQLSWGAFEVFAEAHGTRYQGGRFRLKVWGFGGPSALGLARLHAQVLKEPWALERTSARELWDHFANRALRRGCPVVSLWSLWPPGSVQNPQLMRQAHGTLNPFAARWVHRLLAEPLAHAFQKAFLKK